MWRAGVSREDVARNSKHSTAHVLEMFEAPEPNPSLRLYLDVLAAAGARFPGIRDNTPKAVIERLAELRDQRGLKNSDLHRISGVPRQTISTLFNDTDPNPGLAMFDKLVEALEAHKEFGIVSVSDARSYFRTFVGGAGSVTTEAPSGSTRPPPSIHVVDEPPHPMGADERRRAEEAEARERAADQRAKVSFDREQTANERHSHMQQRCDDLHAKNMNLERENLEAQYALRDLRTERRWDIAKKVAAGAACFIAGGLVTAAVMPSRK